MEREKWQTEEAKNEELSEFEQQERYQYLREILSSYQDRLPKGDRMKNYLQLSAQAETLKNKYPDYQKYLLYHLLISSTCTDCTKFDFPVGDSVEEFILDNFSEEPDVELESV